MGKVRAALKKALLGPEPPALEAVLTADQLHGWREKGFLILKALIPPELVAAVNAEVDTAGTERQLGNPYVESAIVKQAALDERLASIVSALLRGHPIIVNSLRLNGHRQPGHFDIWRVRPAAADRSVVSSICLETVHPDAGPIFCYPGSHRIPPYPPPSDAILSAEQETSLCRSYLENEIAARGLAKTALLGVAGDVFVWHSRLLHGGLPVRNAARTRKSLLTLYRRK